MTETNGSVGIDVQVTPAATVEIEVEIAEDVTAFIDGKEVKPGKRVFLDPNSAMNLVALGQAKITGSKESK